jgi:hypothetical protein
VRTGASSHRTAIAPKRNLRDPHGGLTSAGRAAFRRRDGSRLRPGVKKAERALSAEDMRRKGSWAVRSYGRKTLPPLVDADGDPTRFALSAAAWGEPVPRTEAAARLITAKGHRRLEKYRRLHDAELRPAGARPAASRRAGVSAARAPRPVPRARR